MNAVASDERAGVLHEQDQHLHRNPLEPHGGALPAQRKRRDIQLEVAEAEAAGHSCGSYWNLQRNFRRPLWRARSSSGHDRPLFD